VVVQSLHRALRELSISLPALALSTLTTAYDHLAASPDVPPALAVLAESTAISFVVFLNGTLEMIHSNIYDAELKVQAGVFKRVIRLMRLESISLPQKSTTC
jgi:hypothetical protein